MNLTEFKSLLRAHPARNVSLVLPDGRLIPAHFHVTEVGHIARKFVDCGGTFRASEICLLQTYFGSRKDDGHRLTAGRLAHILDHAAKILPHGELPVQIEYEDGIVAQFPLVGGEISGTALQLRLGLRHTDCLAKTKCGIDDGCGGDDPAEPGAAEGCCGHPAGTSCC
jgi:hypothetical protein